MHDTYLLEKISSSVKELCEENKIDKISELGLITDNDSHIDEPSLHKHLSIHNADFVGQWTKINIKRESLGAQIAVIYRLEGEREDGK